MSKMTRRGVLAAAGGAALGRATAGQSKAAPQRLPRKGQPLDIQDFLPKSMLHVKETRVERPRHPLIDVHTHLTFSAREKAGVPVGEAQKTIWPAEKLLPVMDRKNVRIMVNLTGGVGKGLAEGVKQFDKAHPGRFLTFTEPTWERAAQPDYPKFQADEIERAHKAGARGLKVLKTLGLYLREGISTGPLVKIDDRRLDPMWEVCGSLGLPVAIHVSDPEAFFLPIDRFNERFEELNNHPDWSFHGKDFPSNRELLESRNRVFERHPGTQFIVLHFGNFAENLEYVGQCMDRYPNTHVELGARIGELGRQPRASRRFFERHQDRIMFGTDAVPDGYETPQQVFVDALYEIYFRFLETEDEYFDYAPAPVPPQGRWRIYGIGLPDQILKKVYWDNAARVLNVTA